MRNINQVIGRLRDNDLLPQSVLEELLEEQLSKAPNPPKLLSHDRANVLLNARDELRAALYDKLIVARPLLLCQLPYRSSTEPFVVSRSQLGPTDTIETRYSASNAPETPLPFGADRALLGYVQTRGITDGVITLGALTEYFSAFGIQPNGKAYRAFYASLERLRYLHVMVTRRGPSHDDRAEKRTLGLTPLQGVYTPDSPADLPDAKSDPLQIRLFRARYALTLDPAFHALIQREPIVLPLPLLRAFRNAPRSYDFAAWATWRSCAAQRASRMSCAQFHAEFDASNDTNPYRLEAAFRQVLEEIRVVYPDFPMLMLPRRRGLLIEPWRPPEGLPQRRALPATRPPLLDEPS
jgi:hypothetical protein